VSYATSNAGVNVNLWVVDNDYVTTLITTISGGIATGDRLKDIEKIEGSDHDDTLNGNNEDNILKGGAGDGNLAGREGDDTLDGGTGRNILTGGTGDDLSIVDDLFILDSTNTVSDVTTASVITDFAVPASATATNVDTDSIMLTGNITTIWIDQSATVATGLGGNNAAVSDTVVYTDAEKTQILVVLQDFTGDLTGHVTNDAGVEVSIL
jgi:hypothetical protein